MDDSPATTLESPESGTWNAAKELRPKKLWKIGGSNSRHWKIMLVNQCHKPPIWIDGSYHPFMVKFGDGGSYCFTNISPCFQKHYPFLGRLQLDEVNFLLSGNAWQILNGRFCAKTALPQLPGIASAASGAFAEKWGVRSVDLLSGTPFVSAPSCMICHHSLCQSQVQCVL